MSVFFLFFYFIKHAQILLLRRFFSTFLSLPFFNEGPKINEGFFLKQKKGALFDKKLLSATLSVYLEFCKTISKNRLFSGIDIFVCH